MREGWIGVDLDGTLAFYDQPRGPEHIGEPIPAMLARVRRWLIEGKDVRIFTARVSVGDVVLSMNEDGGVMTAERLIKNWCKKHLGRELPVTCKKDYGMVQLWDDRCIQVIPNTGRTIVDELESERNALAGKVAEPAKRS
jgi:hypothetical protein